MNAAFLKPILPENLSNWLDANPSVTVLLIILVIISVSMMANFIAKKIILKIISIVIKISKNQFDDVLIKNKVFHRLSHVAPALIIYSMAPLVKGRSPFFDYINMDTILERLSMMYIIVIAVSTLSAFLNSISDVYNNWSFSKSKPIKGYIQVVKIVLFTLCGIFVISTLLNKSPWGILSGIGAMSAIVLLIFKDSIMGLVAGFQLTANKMVQIGDWIEMPKHKADGDVIDISLTTVKVQNWDKTISTIPTYSLISDSFKNWKGMNESGGRRIKRSLNIDMNSISFLSDEEIQKLSGVQLLNNYLAQKQEEVSSHNKSNNIQTSSSVNGRRLTNIGTYRAYIQAYLREHPKIHKNMTFLIRQLKPSPEGLPLEIYVFSNDQNWVNYEGIQADIFDHLIAALPEFGLRPFQQPTGLDFRSAYKSS